MINVNLKEEIKRLRNVVRQFHSEREMLIRKTKKEEQERIWHNLIMQIEEDAICQIIEIDPDDAHNMIFQDKQIP